MEGIGTGVFVIICLIGFLGYVIFKQIQFILVSVNLYKKMVEQQAGMIDLLLDMRDNTKHFDAAKWVNRREGLI